MQNTDFGKALQRRKPRPHDIIAGTSRERLDLQDDAKRHASDDDQSYTYFNTTLDGGLLDEPQA